jgi:NAD(P)H-hydrate epimerase
MKLVTVQEMQHLEKAANAAGHTYDTMMERAGRAVAQVIQDELDVQETRVLVLVGPGNNGGDGLVAARYLAQAGAKVAVYLAKPRADDDPNVVRLETQAIDWLSAQSDADGQMLRERLQTTDVLVDALLGTGVDRPIQGSLAEILRAARQVVQARRTGRKTAPTYLGTSTETRGSAYPSNRPLIVAVDVPSGVSCDTGAVDPVALPADVTITFSAAKLGQFRFPAAQALGQLIVADIGISPALSADIQREVATHAEIAQHLPARPPNAHKGTFGKAMIVAGSANYVGAAYLAAAAAGRVGAGLVTMAAPASLHPILASRLAEATHLLLPHDMGALVPAATKILADHLDGYASLLLGPGLGQAPETINLMHRLFGIERERHGRQIGFQRSADPPSTPQPLPPLVVDADALNALAAIKEWWRHLPPHSVLTPHPGEMGRLMDAQVSTINADRIATATHQAAKWGHIVVLKGAFTVVAAPNGQTTVIPFNTPALATAGTGDVLAGSISGLLAQGLSPHYAALCGAYLHGLAGKMLQDQVGDAGALAGDLIPLLPHAIQKIKGR